MRTTITIMRPNAEPEIRSLFALPAQPSSVQLHEIVDPLIGTRDMERVNVFWEGAYTDMFVDGASFHKGLPRNEQATRIYRNNWLTHKDPKADPESLPAIYGPAVLFSRKVWF